MVFIQLHRRSCYLKVYLFWLNYVRASVNMTQSYMKTVYQMFIRSPRPPTFDGILETTVLPKKRQWPEIFGTLKNDSNYLWGQFSSGQVSEVDHFHPNPPPLRPLIQTLWVCCTAGFTSDGQGDEKPRPSFTSRLFKDLLPEVRLFLLHLSLPFCRGLSSWEPTCFSCVQTVQANN